MFEWKSMLVSPDQTVLDTIAIIDKSGAQAAVVVDDQGRLRGVVTDGDVRRGILRGIRNTDPVRMILNPSPTSVPAGTPDERIDELMAIKGILQVPVVDADGRLVDVKLSDRLRLNRQYDIPVVLMAGGEGKRLYPLTADVPKPLLKVGGRPILEVIVQNFVEQGFRKFFLSVNYKAEMVENHFGDGSKWGAEIQYLREKTRLGTAGALSMLPASLKGPVIVMNGDVLTKVNFGSLIAFHRKENAVATMAVRDFEYQIPYGVVKIDSNIIQSIQEKPIRTYFVNAGIYVLSDEARAMIPRDGAYFDMPQLFHQALSSGQRTAAFAIREYWLDIGQRADFDRASEDYRQHFED